MFLTDGQLAEIVTEIQDEAEVNRRAQAKRRLDIYRDGGKEFLLERIRREFGEDAIKEMRLTPINLLKKIVDKRAGIYKRAPTRKAELPSDQALVDYYVKEIGLDAVMQKVNRYLVLSSNTVLYIRPKNGELCAHVVPNYLYSIIPNEYEKSEPAGFVFSAFVDEGRVAPQAAPYSATGYESFSEERSDKPTSKQLIDSREKDNRTAASQYIVWTDEQHCTLDEKGSKYAMPGAGDEQYLNPIGMLPVINVARDRDNESWATQGEDMIDLTLAIQMGWTDVMTIAKHQGFSILTITSEEEPKKLNIGVNRAVWLKTSPQGPQPSIGYVQGQSPLDEYKNLLTELLGLLLTTNNMSPGSIGGNQSGKTFTSGFHALIEMADSLEAIEQDKPLMANVEHETWEVIAAWHNWMFDQDMLDPEVRALGKFSEDFEISVQFADVKPLESEDERIARVKTLIDMGLLTREGALRKLHPDMTAEQISAMIAEIDAEKAGNVARAQAMFAPAEQPIVAEDDEGGLPVEETEGKDDASEEESDEESV